MSYLAFSSRAGAIHLPGRQVQAILGLAQSRLAVGLSRPRHRPLRDELGLPHVDSPFFESRLFWLMCDGEAHRACGHDVYLLDLALQYMYERSRENGVLCWLFDNGARHGWVAAADRATMAAETETVLGGGPPVLDRDSWGQVIAFLRGGSGDVVTSLAPAEDFPHWRLPRDTGAWRPAVRNPGEPGDELEGLWGQLSDGARWELGMTALGGGPARQWHPGQYKFSYFTLSNAWGRPGGVALVE